MSKNTEKTKVVFRKFRDGEKEIIALFPEEIADFNPCNCVAYMHTGQHGSASRFLTNSTDRAKPEEYKDLKGELERLCYSLQIMKKITKQDDDLRLRKILSMG